MSINWNEFASINVRIGYANLSKVNKIRAWARKNGAVCYLSRYAKDAFDGHVKVPMPGNREQQAAKVKELKAIIG